MKKYIPYNELKPLPFFPPRAPHIYNRELKQQSFWATHVNRKWPFFIFWRWFRANFQSNRLYNSKEAKEYKFYIIKAC